MDTDLINLCDLCQKAGVRLRLSQETIATSQVYLHRYKRLNETQNFSDRMLATASLFLASKVEEHPRKIRDFINVFRILNDPNAPPLEINDSYRKLKDAVVSCEQILLRSLAFDFDVEHPYKYLLNYCMSLNLSKEIVQVSFSLINDSYKAGLVLDVDVKILAVAAIYVACELLNEVNVLPAKNGDREWWSLFGVSDQEIEAASKILLAIVFNNISS